MKTTRRCYYHLLEILSTFSTEQRRQLTPEGGQGHRRVAAGLVLFMVCIRRRAVASAELGPETSGVRRGCERQTHNVGRNSSSPCTQTQRGRVVFLRPLTVRLVQTGRHLGEVDAVLVTVEMTSGGSGQVAAHLLQQIRCRGDDQIMNY